MRFPLLLALSILGICLFVLFYFVSKIMYRKRHETKYHFYQMFPYEFNYPGFFKENFYGNFLMILASGCVIAFYQVSPFTSIYSIVAIALSILSTMLLILILLLPLRYLRTHMALSVASMTVTAVLPLFNLFLALNQMKATTSDTYKILCIISMVISGLLSLTMVLLILNPKLSFNIYYDKEIDEEGNEVLKRPKIIFLALNEWWSFFIFFLSTIGILLLTIV